MAEAWLGLLGFELVRRQGFERVLEKVSQQYIKRVFSRHIYIYTFRWIVINYRGLSTRWPDRKYLTSFFPVYSYALYSPDCGDRGY